MSLLLAAVTPHFPLLHAGIRETEESQLQSTTIAMQRIAQECYATRIKTIVVITAHEEQYERSFGIFAMPQVQSSYLEFGDGVSSETYPTNLKLVSNIIEESRKSRINISTLPLTTIHYGSAIPLIPLKKLDKNISVVIISPPKVCSYPELLSFGYLLKEVLLNTNDRTMLCISGETSHAIKKDGLLPYHTTASTAQSRLLKTLEELDPAHLYRIDTEKIETFGMCLTKPAAVLLGCLKNTQPHIERLSFEDYEGVGLATILYTFNRKPV
jgi:aromatic ring-opening dioxygenase LigB subunit